MNFPNNNFCNPNQSWTPELMNQWSTNQEMIYQNIPHDKGKLGDTLADYNRILIE